MNKQALIGTITQHLASIGIQCVVGSGTDISVNSELLDAKWGSGQKKIEYQAAAYFDETAKTIFFWELTKETGSGFSFGVNRESSFQSGATLSRKVKSIGYGPDGKAYEYEFNLGAVSKTFKDAAKASSWKFKIVLKRDKALYPR
ncbi:MAG: hypothetical protein AB1767_09670 [Bacillota bacterium]